MRLMIPRSQIKHDSIRSNTSSLKNRHTEDSAKQFDRGSNNGERVPKTSKVCFLRREKVLEVVEYLLYHFI